jgi:hypothetical protein
MNEEEVILWTAEKRPYTRPVGFRPNTEAA